MIRWLTSGESCEAGGKRVRVTVNLWTREKNLHGKFLCLSENFLGVFPFFLSFATESEKFLFSQEIILDGKFYHVLDLSYIIFGAINLCSSYGASEMCKYGNYVGPYSWMKSRYMRGWNLIFRHNGLLKTENFSLLNFHRFELLRQQNNIVTVVWWSLNNP